MWLSYLVLALEHDYPKCCILGNILSKNWDFETFSLQFSTKVQKILMMLNFFNRHSKSFDKQIQPNQYTLIKKSVTQLFFNIFSYTPKFSTKTFEHKCNVQKKINAKRPPITYINIIMVEKGGRRVTKNIHFFWYFSLF